MSLLFHESLNTLLTWYFYSFFQYFYSYHENLIISFPVFLLCRHQNQIIKLQNKIRHLKNEGSLLENEMNQPEDGLDSEMNDLEVSPSIKQNDNSGLTKIPGPAAKQKKCCKNLLAQALVFEVRTLRFFNKEIFTHCENADNPCS